MANLIGYARVSTTGQATDGHSMDAQLSKLEAYCTLHDHTLVDVVADSGASGSTLARPGLQDALQRLRDGQADGLVIIKLDRLTRSVKDWAGLLEDYFGPDAPHQLHAVQDHLDTTTAGGRLVTGILMQVSQWERETISERTRAVLAHRKAHGKRTGGIPYGYALGSDGESLVPNQAEQETIHAAQRLGDEGHSLRSIARELAVRGHRQRNGRPFTASTVRSLLRADVDAHHAHQG